MNNLDKPFAGGKPGNGCLSVAVALPVLLLGLAVRRLLAHADWDWSEGRRFTHGNGDTEKGGCALPLIGAFSGAWLLRRALTVKIDSNTPANSEPWHNPGCFTGNSLIGLLLAIPALVRNRNADR